MKISEIFSKQTLYNTERTGEAAKVDAEAQAARSRAAAEGEDQVSISSGARQFQQLGSLLAEDAQARQDRVAELKAQVASGNYAPSSTDVAGAIDSFLFERS